MKPVHTMGNVPQPQQDGRDEQHSLTELLRQLANDSTDLVRGEINLAKLEMKEAAGTMGQAAVKIGIAAGLALTGGMALTAFLVIGLGVLINSYWASALIVGVVFLAVGALLAKRAMDNVSADNLKPTETMATLQEDKRWAKQEAQQFKREVLS